METSAPVKSKPKPQVEQSEHAMDPTPVAPESKAEKTTKVSGDVSRVGATKTSLLESNHHPAAGPGTTRSEASSADEVQEPVVTGSRADTKLDSAEGVAAILSILLTKGNQETGTDSAPQITPVPGPASHYGQGVAISVGSDGVLIGATPIAYPQAPVQDKQGAIFTVNGHSYTVRKQSGSLQINGAPASAGDVVTINGDVLTIGSNAINIDGTTIPLTGGQTTESPAGTGANIVIAGKTMAALRYGDGVLVDGAKLTLGQVATLAGIQISVGSEGIVVGASTASFHKTGGSTTGSDDAVAVDGTAYSASKLPGQSDAVLLAGPTLSRGVLAVTVDGEVVTYGSHGLSVIASTGSATATPTYDLANSVVTIDGTAYTATPVQGCSGLVVLDGQTLSIDSFGVKIAKPSVTGGSNGISLVDWTVSASDGASSSRTTSTTGGMAESYTLAVQQSSAAREKESSGSPKTAHGSYFLTLTVAMTVIMLSKLQMEPVEMRRMNY